MAEQEASRTGWEHTVLVVLFGPRKNPRRERRFFSLVTLVSLVSPGSVPFAVAATAIEATFAMDHYTGQRYAWAVAALRVGIPVVLAGYRPFVAWVVVALATPLGALMVRPVPFDLGQPWPFIPTALSAYWIVQYAVARAHRRHVSLATFAVMAAIAMLLATRNPLYSTRWALVALLIVFSFVWWLVGDVVRVQLTSRQRLAEEERLTAEERAKRRLLEDRARIARELHDVVAHHMSVIAVQASTAAYRIEASATPRARSSRRSATPPAPRSRRCAGCSRCCATTTTRRSACRSRDSPASRRWSRPRAARAPRCRSTCGGRRTNWPTRSR